MANYTNWAKGQTNGQPNGNDAQNCVWKTYQKQYPGWHDAYCTDTNYANGYGEQHALCQMKK